MFLSGISEWIATIASGVSGVVEWAGAKATAEINKWTADFAAFRNTLAQLQATPATTTAGNTARNALLARAKEISDKAQWIDEQIRTLSGWFGLSDYRGLGFLPVLAVPAVVVAAIVAVTALIYKWSSDAATYLRENRATAANVASGMTPAQAIAAAQSANRPTGGLFGDVGGLIWPLAIGAAALYLLKGR